MALAEQYYASTTSYNGWGVYIEIWVEGFSLSWVTRLMLG